jgi:hypothetical protein
MRLRVRVRVCSCLRLCRYLTHVHWLESLLMPSGEEGSAAKGELGGLTVVKDAGSTLVVDESSIEVRVPSMTASCRKPHN